MKALLIVVGVLVLLGGIGSLMGGDDKSGASTSSSDSTATSSSASSTEGTANLHLVKRLSFCMSNPYDARLFVYVTVRNDGPQAGSIDVRPWRRYSDGSENDSIMDMFTVTVPAYGQKKVYGKYDYNAEEHQLLECGVFMGNTSVTPTMLKVV